MLDLLASDFTAGFALGALIFFVGGYAWGWEGARSHYAGKWLRDFDDTTN